MESQVRRGKIRPYEDRIPGKSERCRIPEDACEVRSAVDRELSRMVCFRDPEIVRSLKEPNVVGVVDGQFVKEASLSCDLCEELPFYLPGCLQPL